MLCYTDIYKVPLIGNYSEEAQSYVPECCVLTMQIFLPLNSITI